MVAGMGFFVVALWAECWDVSKAAAKDYFGVVDWVELKELRRVE